jgi:hypothetical protein
MKMKLFKSIAATFILFAFSEIFGQDASAVVVDLKGEARCYRGTELRLRIGSALFDNDSITLSKNSSLILLTNEGKHLTVDRSVRWNIKVKSQSLISLLIARQCEQTEWLAGISKNSQNNKRSGSDPEILMLFPRNTALFEPPNKLTWKIKEKRSEKTEVSLRCYENDFSFDESSNGDSLDLKPVTVLSRGQQYFWYARDASAELSDIPPAVWFKILTHDQIVKLETDKKTIATILNQETESVSFKLLYANLLISHELYYDCKRFLDRLPAAERENQMIDTFYAVLYDKMELPDESRKYIEYSEHRNK